MKSSQLLECIINLLMMWQCTILQYPSALQVQPISFSTCETMAKRWCSTLFPETQNDMEKLQTRH